MRTRIVWSALALLAALALVGGGDAQPPGKKGGKFGKKSSITSEQLVERIMAFDKNNDGKVTADELPERMQHLVALGDVNRDGALDREEVRKLAATLEAFVSLATPNGKGKGKGGFKGKGPDPVQKALDELNLTDATREKADAVARQQRKKVRELQEQARAELLLRMREVLSEPEFNRFKAALDDDPRPPPFGFGKKKGKKGGGE